MLRVWEMPKVALTMPEVPMATAKLPSTVPSLPEPEPRNSPALSQPTGMAAAGAVEPRLP